MSDETALLPCPFCGGEAHVCEGGINGRMTTYGLVEHKDGCFFLSDGLPSKNQHIMENDFDAWNTRATHGTLTAEQVRKAIFNGSSYASYDGAKYYADGINMQAIADELNEALGGGGCDAILDESYYKGIHGYCEGLKCSNCGEPLFREFKSCPWCGKRIRKKVDV